MKLTQSQDLPEGETQIYTAPHSGLPAETPTAEEIELPVTPAASATAPHLNETKTAFRFLNFLRFRLRRKKQSIAEKKSSTALHSGEFTHGLTPEQRRRMRNDRWLIFGPSTAKVLPLILIISGLIVRSQPSNNELILKILLQFFSWMGVLGLWMISWAVFARRRRNALQETDPIDVNVLLYGVGFYVNIINKDLHQHTGNWHQDRQAILQLLPTLQSSDADLVSARSHRILNRCLQSSDPELALSVLEVLPRIGTEAALPHVEALANGTGKLGSDISVRRAAATCLILLNERLAELDTKTLLRASQPQTSGKELLRPADTETVIAPEQLLRAVQNNDIQQLR